MEANNNVFFFQSKNEEIEKLYVSNRWRRAGSRLEKFLHDSVFNCSGFYHCFDRYTNIRSVEIRTR